MHALRIAALLLLGSALACSSDPREALIGVWRADRAATLANADACDCTTPEQHAWLEENLGKMSVAYTAETMTAHIGDVTDGGAYVVQASGPDWLDLRLVDIAADHAPVHRVTIEGDTMRVRAPHLGFEQVFRRVP